MSLIPSVVDQVFKSLLLVVRAIVNLQKYLICDLLPHTDFLLFINFSTSTNVCKNLELQ